MQITAIKCLHADAGFRNFDFLKISTNKGIVGWSEYNESFGGMGVSSVIEQLEPILLGKDPRAYELLVATLFAVRRQAGGGLVQQAIGAIENALLDIKAKDLNIPVYELLGGPIRESIPLYWSHCGTYRIAWPQEMSLKALTSLEDVTTQGKEVVNHGFSALKTNLFRFDDPVGLHCPGFFGGEDFPELNASRQVVNSIKNQLAAFRKGTGSDFDILVDLNFNFKTEGFLKMAHAMEEFQLYWVELDTRSPQALAHIRQQTSIPVASGECLFGRRDYLPFFESQAMDVAIIDTPWNGVSESLKIASMADTFEINVAPHNFYGDLATMMNAHFSAVVPNFQIMEIDVDTVPWHGDLVTVQPQINKGCLKLPTGPGWGTEVNEEAVLAHPVKTTNDS